MPKLELLKGGIEDLEKRLKGSDGVSMDSIRSMIQESMGQRTAGDANATAFRIESSLLTILEKFGASQAQARNQLLRAIGEMLLALNQNQKALDDKIKSLEDSLGTSLGSTGETLSDSVKSAQDALLTAVSAMANEQKAMMSATEQMIAKLPTEIPQPEPVDFSGLEEMLLALSKQLSVPATAPTWVFDIERDGNGRLERVIARPE